MDKKSPFSTEYDISNVTESGATKKGDVSTTADEMKDDLSNKIKSEYKLSKPRRNIIRAKIISE